jgi:hypothetical protein
MAALLIEAQTASTAGSRESGVKPSSRRKLSKAETPAEIIEADGMISSAGSSTGFVSLFCIETSIFKRQHSARGGRTQRFQGAISEGPTSHIFSKSGAASGQQK